MGYWGAEVRNKNHYIPSAGDWVKRLTKISALFDIDNSLS